MENKIIIGLTSSIITLIVANLWSKFRNRIAVLNYQVWHQYLAASGSDPAFGSVQVLYNNISVQNLYMSTVKIVNDSNRDLKNVIVNIQSDPDSVILISNGYNRSSLKSLSFTEEYGAALIAKANISYLITHRDYLAPVINRGDQLTFTLLVSNNANKQPYLTLGCDHVGVKLKFSQGLPELMGEPILHSSRIGILLALLLCFPIVYYIPNKVIAVLVAAVVGIFAVVLGILARKISKFVIKILS